MAAALAFLLRIARAVGDDWAVVPAFIICAAALHFSGVFAPGDIDHHNASSPILAAHHRPDRWTRLLSRKSHITRPTTMRAVMAARQSVSWTLWWWMLAGRKDAAEVQRGSEMMKARTAQSYATARAIRSTESQRRRHERRGPG